MIDNANLEQQQLIYAIMLKNYESEVESHASSPNDEFYSWTSVYTNPMIFRKDDVTIRLTKKGNTVKWGGCHKNG